MLTKNTITLATLAVAFMTTWGCGDLISGGSGGGATGPLTEDESKFIYANTLKKINDEAAFLQSPETNGCAPRGAFTLTGTVEGGSSDRTYDIDMTASDCEMVAINADGSRLELVVNGGPVKGVKTADGGITLSGSFSWSASDGRSGSCTMTPATSTCE